MLHTGLCSITFRNLSVSEIINLTQEAGLDAIEWGGDVHVPAGDIRLAESVKQQTEAAGLKVCSYGSYYRSNKDDTPFADVLNSAIALGAPVIRIWAGSKGSSETTQGERTEVAEYIRNAVIEAKKVDITIALEYHGDTLTDTLESAHQLLAEVNCTELKLCWQPRASVSFEDNIPELEAALPHLSQVHLFHWGPGGWIDRQPLSKGISEWSEYLKRIKHTQQDHFVLFEFVKDDQPDQLLQDAQVLKTLLV